MKTTIRIVACVFLMAICIIALAQGTSKKTAVLANGAAPDGTWKWELQFWPGFDKCAGSGGNNCGTEVFHIQNDSDDVIECSGFVEYKGRKPLEFQTRIRAKDSWSNPIILPAYGLKVKAQDAKCVKYVPEPVLRQAEGCKTESRGANLKDFYPKESQKVEETGRVRVRLSLGKSEGLAADVHVVDRSGFKRLDDAAVNFVKALQFTTTCGPSTFDMVINFKLAE